MKDNTIVMNIDGKEIKFDIPTVSAVIPFKKARSQAGDGENDII